MSVDGYVLQARADDGEQRFESPSVGIFTPSVREGDLVAAGQTIGTLDALGVRRPLVLGEGAAGRVTHRVGRPLCRVAVQYGDTLIALSSASVASPRARVAASEESNEASLTFDAPMSGRFYSRPSPQEARFVQEGDTVVKGQTIGLLEVMKTFNRLVYQGDALPERARVVQIVPEDGEDVTRGDALLRIDAHAES
jgi:acetyl-CoA carboxylase biotin carboxyl carrier protein